MQRPPGAQEFEKWHLDGLNDSRADFKSLYESGSALRGLRNLKNGTWADFKSFSPIASSVAEFAIKTYSGRRARPYYIDPSKFQPKLSDQSFIFQFSVRKLDFLARSRFREFQVDLIKSLGRAGGDGDDGDS